MDGECCCYGFLVVGVGDDEEVVFGEMVDDYVVDDFV